MTAQAPLPDKAPLRYRLITGPDDAAFCRRVSDLLDDGYELYGGPAITAGEGGAIVAQALVLPGTAGA
jgi:hypothetical protein